MRRNYVISDEARRSAARAWGHLQGKINLLERNAAIALFDELRSIDENFYAHNVCKLLYYRNDKGFIDFENSEFGPIHYIVGHGYRRGKGVDADITSAKNQYKLGLRSGNIPCRLAYYSTFPIWKKFLYVPMILTYGAIFVSIKYKNEYDTRVLY